MSPEFKNVLGEGDRVVIEKVGGKVVFSIESSKTGIGEVRKEIKKIEWRVSLDEKLRKFYAAVVDQKANELMPETEIGTDFDSEKTCLLEHLSKGKRLGFNPLEVIEFSSGVLKSYNPAETRMGFGSSIALSAQYETLLCIGDVWSVKSKKRKGKKS
jgi:hypothetical protein